ncbi:hypothetical protein MNV49_005301 [Pseudohyphozyma bogoriensis]|nr:hypothetical protein MNV49_005301 [Pseudohyphozyma bogoriensis]
MAVRLPRRVRENLRPLIALLAVASLYLYFSSSSTIPIETESTFPLPTGPPLDLERIRVTKDELEAKPRTRPGSKECEEVEQDTLMELAWRERDPRRPKVYLFRGGTVVQDTRVEGPVSLCVVAIVPQIDPDFTFADAPLPGYGPDDLHVFFRSNTTWITITPLTTIGQSGSAVVYSSPVVLLHPGVYRVSGEIDYRNYKWISEPVSKNFANISLQVSNRFLTVTGNSEPASLPPCYSRAGPKIDSSIGRWRKPQMNTEYGKSLVDSEGWVFTPDYCRLHPIPYPRQISMLSHKNLHVFGDSFWRRAFKDVASRGAFCRGRTPPWGVKWKDWTQCWCEDRGMKDVVGVDFDRMYKDVPVTGVFGDQTKLSLLFTSGWQVPNPDLPLKHFLWPSSLPPSSLSPNLARPPPDMPTPDFLGIGFPIHDNMMHGDVRTFKKDVVDLVKGVFQAYPRVPKVFMLSPLLCCASEPTNRRAWSATRSHFFNTATKEVVLRYTPPGEEGNVVFWDFSHMAGTTRPDVTTTRYCRSAHADWDKVAASNQVLFNALEGLGW